MKRKALFKFSSFSLKQKMVLEWWIPGSPYADKDGIICDGSIRSGKTTVMPLSFVVWAMETFDGESFALCGKTIQSLRRNVIRQLKQMLCSRGYALSDHHSENCITVCKNGVENEFYLFGGKDEGAQDLIQGIPLREDIGAAEICEEFIKFYRMAILKYSRVDWIFPDSASPTMINSLRAAAKTAGLPYRNINGCRKNEVADRPKTVDLLFNTGRLKINKRCKEVRKAIASLRWDEDHPDIPEDKNIGNCNDWWDGFCYMLLDFIEYIDLDR